MDAGALKIGVDFDNTIVCYDGMFYRGALERGWIPSDIGSGKTAVRDYLRQAGEEPLWTELQGMVYGPLMQYARPFPGVADFFRYCRESGISLYIVSHRTRYPYLGEKHDLHQAAQEWLTLQGFVDGADMLIERDRIFFELTKEAKQKRIGDLGCTHFIDDLPEFLDDSGFPPGVEKILFDPAAVFEDSKLRRAVNWQEILEVIREEAYGK